MCQNIVRVNKTFEGLQDARCMNWAICGMAPVPSETTTHPGPAERRCCSTPPTAGASKRSQVLAVLPNMQRVLGRLGRKSLVQFRDVVDVTLCAPVGWCYAGQVVMCMFGLL